MAMFKRKRVPLPRDDFGGGADGSLAILDASEEHLVHTTSARVAASLRYLVARVRIHDGEEFPPCLAMTAALKGEGVTFVTRSLASVMAYDTASSVVVVDLNWAAPGGPRRRRRRSLRASDPVVEPTPIPAFRPGETVVGEPGLAPRDDRDQDGSAVDPTDDTLDDDLSDISVVGDDATSDEVDGEEDEQTERLLDDERPSATVDGDGVDIDEDEDDDEGDEPAPARKALIDVLNGLATLDEVIRPTSNPRLSLIQPGVAAFAHRPGLAGDPRLRAVIDELRQRYDHVLLDLPPVLASSEAIILAELADAFVLVVRQGVTSEQHVAAALEELQGSEALGVVLNRVDSSVPKQLRRLLGV